MINPVLLALLRPVIPAVVGALSALVAAQYPSVYAMICYAG